MANIALKYQEATLVGNIVNASLTDTGLSVDVEFIDSKTGVARTPQASTNVFHFDKDSELYEEILSDSHSTTGGVTTIIINVSGRNMNHYEEGIGSATGFAHALGAEVGCAETVSPFGTLNKIMDGTNNTTGENFRVGNDADNDIKYYAANGDANEPFMQYDSANDKWVFSNDGSSTTDMGGGTGSITAGDGIDIAAGVVSTDLKANSGLKIDTTELALDVRSNFGLAVDSNGLYTDLATDKGLEFDTGKLAVKLKAGGGITVNSDGLSATTDDTYTTDYTYGETIAVGDVLYHKRSDNKVWKVTSSVDTWDTIVGVANETGVADDTGKQIQTSGLITGASFSAVNPSFSDSGGSSNLNIGDATTMAFAWRLDNTAGAEALVDSVTIRVKKNAAPVQSFNVALCLGDDLRPAFAGAKNASTQVGATLAIVTKTAATFSGAYEDYLYDFSDIQCPANSYLWAVAYVTAQDGANYYHLEYDATGATSATMETDTNNSTWTARTYSPNYTAATTSVNPWEKRYAVRAYNGTNGGSGIGEESGTSPWGRVIGHAVSATTWYLDLNYNDRYDGNFTDTHVEGTAWFHQSATTNFRPTAMNIVMDTNTAIEGMQTNALTNDNADLSMEGNGIAQTMDAAARLITVPFEDSIHFTAACNTTTNDNWSVGVSVNQKGTYSSR